MVGWVCGFFFQNKQCSSTIWSIRGFNWPLLDRIKHLGFLGTWLINKALVVELGGHHLHSLIIIVINRLELRQFFFSVCMQGHLSMILCFSSPADLAFSFMHGNILIFLFGLKLGGHGKIMADQSTWNLSFQSNVCMRARMTCIVVIMDSEEEGELLSFRIREVAGGKKKKLKFAWHILDIGKAMTFSTIFEVLVKIDQDQARWRGRLLFSRLLWCRPAHVC